MANEVKQFTIGGVTHDVMDVGARQLIADLQAAINAITSGDTTTAIKTFQEVIDFLDGVTDDATLIGKLNELRTLISAKVDKVTGKGLSTEDYTTAEKQKLAGLSNYDDTAIQNAIVAKYTKPSTGIPASDLASGVIPDISGKANSADVYTKAEVDDKVANAGKVKSVSINNGTPEQPDAQGNVNIEVQGADGKSAYQSYLDTTSDNPKKTEVQWVASLKGKDGATGATGPQGNSGVASADGIESVNNLNGAPADTESKVYVLGANMGKELNLDVNGFDFVGTWGNGLWPSTSGLSVGGTYSESTPDTSYSAGNYRYCEKFLVGAGMNYRIVTKCNQYHRSIVITKTDGEIVYLGELNSNNVDYTTSFEYDVIVYVTAHKDFTDKSVTCHIDGHEQRIARLEDEVAEINPALIDAQINGRDIRATFIDNAYYNTDNVAVGSTFNPSTRTYTGFKCAKQAVKAGDNAIVVAMGSAYHFPVIITNSGNVVVALEPKNTFVNKTITIEQDGYIYVNNVNTNYTTPICHIYNASAKQMAESVMATLPTSSFIEGQSTYLPLMRGYNPFPSTKGYYMELAYSDSSKCNTPWLTMPRGTYILPNMNFKVFQADAPLFHGEYAKLNENIWQTLLQTGGVVEITHDYVMFVISGQSTSADLATLAPIYCDMVTSPAVEREDVAHVGHRTNGQIYIYLPLRNKYYCFEMLHYVSNSSHLEHYGINNVYMCESAGYPFPQTKLTRDSEYECAIDIQGQGYLGGHMHGHEQMVTADTTIYFNGQSKTLDTSFGGEVTGMFEMMQHSILYKTDNTTKVADIYKRWRVVDGKLHMYNRVVFAASYHINRAQFSMFGILRHEGDDTSNPYLTCFASRNSDTRVYHTTDGWDTSSPTDGASVIAVPAKATLQEQWGESGYIVRQEIFENNQKENGGMWISTNGSTYNKMYFEVGSNFDVVNGDELFSHAVLSIE